MPAKPKPSPVALDSTERTHACTMHLITSREQFHGAVQRELMDMPYLSTKIMRGYLREFKQGWRTGAVAYICVNGAIVAMGLCLTVKPVFVPPTHVVAFYVMPAFRRQGLGAQLYRTVTGAVPVAKGPWVYDHDDKSHGFYSKLGLVKPDDGFDPRPGSP